MALIDLNNLGGRQYPEERDHSGSSRQTEYLFRGLRRRLLRLFDEAIQKGWACFGAVAWLTDPLILDAMAKLPCSVIVQKEDFLRPDLDDAGADRETWTSRLHRQYEAIRYSDSIGPAGAYFQRQHMPWPLCAMSESGDPEIAGVRCFGLHNDRSGDPARRRPLMHLKYLVFAEPILETVPSPDGEGMQETVSWKGRALWSGSCNLSLMASRSCEVAYIFRDPAIADAHIRHWAQIAARSETLDWTSIWIDSQWRLGS